MIKPKEDAVAIRRYLESHVKEIATTGGIVSAIQIGFEVSQAGWFFVGADRREQHQRDGQWTLALRDDNKLNMGHWIAAAPTKVGKLILEVVHAARTDGVFTSLGKAGTIQIDIEDFDGQWAWPKYEELGKTNLM